MSEQGIAPEAIAYQQGDRRNGQGIESERLAKLQVQQGMEGPLGPAAGTVQSSKLLQRTGRKESGCRRVKSKVNARNDKQQAADKKRVPPAYVPGFQHKGHGLEPVPHGRVQAEYDHEQDIQQNHRDADKETDLGPFPRLPGAFQRIGVISRVVFRVDTGRVDNPNDPEGKTAKDRNQDG